MNTVIQARIDTASKKEAEAILNQMGMSLNDGIRVFIRQVIHQRALPFRPSLPEIPNEETCKAMIIFPVKTGMDSALLKLLMRRWLIC